MQTECPHCNTVFNVSETELEQANGQVRCGHCLAIFTADNPYSSLSLSTEENPETNTEENPHAFFEETNAEDEETAENKHIVADVIPPELRAETHAGKNKFGFFGTLVLSLSILMAISMILVQYAYYNLNSLAKITELRPWLNIMCQQAPCTLPPPKDRKSIFLSSKNIYSHPNVDNALMVSASIVNQAKFAQAFPIIELRFENVRGEIIAGRRFTPEEYLGIPEDQITKMQPDVSINISLEILDPGKDMVSYEFAFL